MSKDNEMIYKNADALKPIEIVLDDASRALDDPSRIASDDSRINEALVAAGGIGAGGAISFASLYFGGSVVGLSAAGISSGLAAAGALVGGGMSAGIAVLAAPAVLLGVGGYALISKRNRQKLLEKKEMLLQAVMQKHDAIILQIQNTAQEDKQRIEYLTGLNFLLQGAIRDLKSDIQVQTA